MSGDRIIPEHGRMRTPEGYRAKCSVCGETWFVERLGWDRLVCSACGNEAGRGWVWDEPTSPPAGPDRTEEALAEMLGPEWREMDRDRLAFYLVRALRTTGRNMDEGQFARLIADLILAYRG